MNYIYLINLFIFCYRFLIRFWILILSQTNNLNNDILISPLVFRAINVNNKFEVNVIILCRIQSILI